jgi:ATP-dependent 26S proteasome regulatory subunit
MSTASPENDKKNPSAHAKFANTVLDPKKPRAIRATMLAAAMQSSDPSTAQSLSDALLSKMEAAGPAAEFEQKTAALTQMLQELEQGGLRVATFVDFADVDLPGATPRAHVITPDGHRRFPFVHPRLSQEKFESGRTVYLDAKGTMVMAIGKWHPTAGAQATFLRRLAGSPQVEISVRDEKLTFHAAQRVLAAIDRGQLKRGDRLLICPQQQFAFDVVPADDDRKFRFVDTTKIPDVLPHRDIGNPHPCLDWLVRRTKILVSRPDLLQKYELRPRVSLLMTGPSGTGKTLTIKAFLTLYRQMIQARTGLADLPSRVVRYRLSEQLSEWLGRSEKNIEELFNDVAALAAQEVRTADDELIRLPVILVIEEVDAAARRRSVSGHDGSGGAMDRIMGTLLQRLDDPTDDLGRLPLVIISTSNFPSAIDVAMHRRLGAKVARFKRLNRRGLAAVLGKKIRPGYPLAARNGTPPDRLRQLLIDQVVSDLFDPMNDDAAVVELTLGDGTKLKKFARDFLTGALVEQALSEAIDEVTMRAEETKRQDIGLDSACLIGALRRQIGSLVENVAPFNAADFVDLPEHTHVANVRRANPPRSRLNDVLLNES